ncbi:MAG: threonine/serine exporter family protein [Mycobacterium sp.]|nr:threonine/serine exporter family protein [Mycobacterium sp.]
MSEDRSTSVRRIMASLRKAPPKPLHPPEPHDPADVAAMLREIGSALLEVHQPTMLVSARLQEIAAQYTSEPVQVVVLPTVLIVQVGAVGYEVGRSAGTSLQLDLAGRVDEIAGQAAAGAISPTDALDAVRRARAARPRFGPVTTTVGYALATLGFGLLVHPTWAALPGYLLLGLVVGAIVQIGRPFPSLNPVLPTVAAMVVTILATWFVADTAQDGLLRVITPALVALLPGISLTVSAMELASSQVISGASRLVAALAQLGLLVFGVAQGLHFAHRLHPQSPPPVMGAWSVYVATVVVGVGLYIYLSAPPASLLWLIAAIGVAVIAQALAATVLPASHTGFVGAVLEVPFAMWAARIKTSPPAIVMMLAAFWALVPGALSFESAAEAVTGGPGGLAALAVTGSAVLSIALGILVGWSIFQTIDSRFTRPRGAPEPVLV